MGKKYDTVENTIAYRKVRKRKELESKIVPKWRFFMVERVWFAQQTSLAICLSPIRLNRQCINILSDFPLFVVIALLSFQSIIIDNLLFLSLSLLLFVLFLL